MGPQTSEEVELLDEVTEADETELEVTAALEASDELIQSAVDLLDPETSPLSLGEAFQIGEDMEYLENVSDLERVSIDKILEVLYSLEATFHSTDFDSAIAPQIKEERDKFESIAEDDGGEPDEDYIDTLSDKANLWRNILYKELDNEKRLAISSRGLLDVEKAMERPEELFEREVWEWLPALPKSNISEGCRCLAIESPTASMFLSLRAVEDCLRRWYESEEQGAELEQTAWGSVLEKLESLYKENNNRPAVLTNLDYLRMKRNEVNHPDKTPTWSEAEATLYIVRNTITEIYEQISPDEEED